VKTATRPRRRFVISVGVLLPAPPAVLTRAEAEDTIRILVATDCHLGAHERDPIRGGDAIRTFKEVLQLARAHDVDMVLMAGDLFHENRPSRDTLFQAMALLREHCLGDRPVELELLSDPDDGKPAGYASVPVPARACRPRADAPARPASPRSTTRTRT
jgi:hypothetical protein